MTDIPFNRPHLVGTETAYIEQAVADGWIAGRGAFSRRCEQWLEQECGSAKAIMVPSGTAALEAAVMLAGVGPGDEVIMPSFTFVSTANAVVLRGGVPVFVDVRADTLNLDPDAVAAAIGPRTKAIAVIHYGGVACDMDAITALADAHGLVVIEDAAQALLASHRGRALGGLGTLAAISFHETKNLTCGEGGALLVNRDDLVERAQVICDKGTDRARFDRGEVDRYTWVDEGSSFALGEVAAAFLWGQIEQAHAVTERRRAVWDRYHAAFAELEARGAARRPVVPDECHHNAHTYHLLARDRAARDRMLAELRARGVGAVFHYVPLHDSAAGCRHGRTAGSLARTEHAAASLLRLPLFAGLTEPEVDRVIAATCEAALEAVA